MEIFMTGIKKMLEFEKAQIAKLKADAAAAKAAETAAALAAVLPPPQSEPSIPTEGGEPNPDEKPLSPKPEEGQAPPEELPMESIEEIPEKE